MRIISGFLGGRRFNPPIKSWKTRPTTDRAREGLFNILEHRIDFTDIRALELFGGSGAHAFECISRGCQDITIVDKYIGCVQFIKQQSREFNIQDRIKVIKDDVKRYMRKDSTAYDYVFADPPYDLPWLADLPDLILQQASLLKGYVVVIEHDNRHKFASHPHYLESRNYGEAIFSFFQELSSSEYDTDLI